MKSISILVPTYARVYWLNECLWGLIRQDYPDYEVIILNDAPQQVLQFDHPNVRIINESANRYSSLGEKRNALMRLASKEWITWVDDDDLILPWHLSRLMEIPNDPKTPVQAVVSHLTYLWDKGNWSDTVSTIETAAELKLALATSGFGDSDCGEDISYRSQLKGSGNWLPTKGKYGSYITCRHHVPMHISDSVNYTGSAQAFRKFAAERMRGNGEPTGLIRLAPQFCRHVYERVPVYAHDLLYSKHKNFFPG